MAKCRNCQAPIFFLTERPVRSVVGGFSGNATEQVTQPSAIPIDVDPHPAGTLAIFEDPPADCIYPKLGRDFVGVRKRYVARLYGFALEAYKRGGDAVLYRVHFDSCPTRNRN